MDDRTIEEAYERMDSLLKGLNEKFEEATELVMSLDENDPNLIDLNFDEFEKFKKHIEDMEQRNQHFKKHGTFK